MLVPASPKVKPNLGCGGDNLPNQSPNLLPENGTNDEPQWFNYTIVTPSQRNAIDLRTPSRRPEKSVTGLGITYSSASTTESGSTLGCQWQSAGEGDIAQETHGASIGDCSSKPRISSLNLEAATTLRQKRHTSRVIKARLEKEPSNQVKVSQINGQDKQYSFSTVHHALHELISSRSRKSCFNSTASNIDRHLPAYTNSIMQTNEKIKEPVSPRFGQLASQRNRYSRRRSISPTAQDDEERQSLATDSGYQLPDFRADESTPGRHVPVIDEEHESLPWKAYSQLTRLQPCSPTSPSMVNLIEQLASHTPFPMSQEWNLSASPCLFTPPPTPPNRQLSLRAMRSPNQPPPTPFLPSVSKFCSTPCTSVFED